MKISKRIQKMGMADLIGYSLNLKRKIEKSVNHYGNLPLTHPKRIYIEKVIRNYTLTLLELNKFPTHIIEKYKQEPQSRVASGHQIRLRQKLCEGYLENLNACEIRKNRGVKGRTFSH